ncbi:hypothetical protein EV421DRAFT_135542 [Armillaria borealis]|uniref:Uncharacterized protein n=1 Tax=Armillaria borealis TaxID=47425 RepID=A0AA39IZP3_9AGAR|nr:hypothetical protein EV421DRAFT_135542 [Armillaria borealis]
MFLSVSFLAVTSHHGSFLLERDPCTSMHWLRGTSTTGAVIASYRCHFSNQSIGGSHANHHTSLSMISCGSRNPVTSPGAAEILRIVTFHMHCGESSFILLSERCRGKSPGGWKGRRVRALIKAAGDGFSEPCMSLGRAAEGVLDNGSIALCARDGSHFRGTCTLTSCVHVAL